VLAEAHAAAKALQAVIAGKANPVLMNGEQYLEFEDWQTLGRFFGITAKEDGDVEFVTFPDGTQGFKASAVAVQRGQAIEITRATAYCLNDEEKWSSRAVYRWFYVTQTGELSEEDPGRDQIVWEDNPKKPGGKRPKKVRQQAGEERVPLYQLASMAQTRANAKALRNVLAWVAVLAGYKPTPAEEMPVAGPSAPETVEAPARPVPPGPDHTGEEWPYDTTAHERHGVEPAQPKATASAGPKAPCPECGKPAGGSKYPKPGKTHYCYPCKFAFDPGVKE
jgi:hypothetical protein